jgi:hypothetical protein
MPRPDLVVNGKRALLLQERPFANLINSDERKQSVTHRLHVRYLDVCHNLESVVATKVDITVLADRTAQTLIQGEAS